MPNSLSLISTPDWGKLTGKPSAFPPDLHKTSHQLAGADAIDCAGLAGRVNYVDRGDPVGPDWSTSAFTTDQTWRDLDCSAIVPSGAVAIVFLLIIADDTIGGRFRFRKNGNSNSYNVPGIDQNVANLYYQAQLLVACDANRIIEYWATTKSWTVITLTVLGWFI